MEDIGIMLVNFRDRYETIPIKVKHQKLYDKEEPRWVKADQCRVKVLVKAEKHEDDSSSTEEDEDETIESDWVISNDEASPGMLLMLRRLNRFFTLFTHSHFFFIIQSESLDSATISNGDSETRTRDQVEEIAEID